MKVRCLGARGSIPVSGPQFVRYGGDTSCIEIVSQGGGRLILDAGTGIRVLGCEMAAQSRREATILFSHFHWDHIQGLPFFKPLYNPTTRLRLAGPRGVDVLRVLSRALRPPFFPVALDQVPCAISTPQWQGDTLEAEGLLVRRIACSHPNKGAGFRVEEGGASLVYLTDNELSLRHRGGLAFDEYVAFCQGADLLIHDTEYTPEEYPQRRGWGHSHFLDAARLAREAGVKTLALFHHNQERTDDDQDALLERCRESLARPGDPQCLALRQGLEMELLG
ncbi:MAG: MBL fold metallo-hydrolase [Desulfovibrio sp.]|nr:MBL fold metallo-hydrolase [Desulfovibrio sp.]